MDETWGLPTRESCDPTVRYAKEANWGPIELEQGRPGPAIGCARKGSVHEEVISSPIMTASRCQLRVPYEKAGDYSLSSSGFFVSSA